MRINNGVGKSVKIKWDNIALPLREGTPINIGGNVANDGTAIGLVMGTVYVKQIGDGTIDILTAGDVDLAEVEKSSGLTLTAEAKSSMSGIKFHLPDGSVDDSADFLRDERIEAKIAAMGQATETKVAPWQKNGQWYHGVVDIATNEYIQDETDADLINKTNISSLSNNKGIIAKPANPSFKILSVKTKFVDYVRTVSDYVSLGRFWNPDGRVGFSLYPGNNNTSGKCEIWVFAVEESTQADE